MARSSVKMNFSFNQLSRRLAKNITDGINQLGKQVNIDIGKMMQRKNNIVKKLTTGIGFLFKKKCHCNKS